MGQILTAQEINIPHAGTQASTVANWRGRSGQFYTLTSEPLDSFALMGRDIYVLTSGSEVLWMGTADEIVADTNSRACFRTAIKLASSVLRLDAPATDGASMQARWDIEGGQLAGALSLVN